MNLYPPEFFLMHAFYWFYMFITIGYYICVPWFLWMIWQKVRHLPS